MTDIDPLVHRAAAILRSSPEPGWDAIRAQVIAAVRATPRHAWPLQTSTPPGPPSEGSVYISDHVLRSTVARELRRTYLCQPTAIDIEFNATELRALTITITASYGAHLHTLAERIRATTAQIITGLYAHHGTSARAHIDIIITDILTGDPLTPESYPDRGDPTHP
ncbi:MAG: hypothetical protein DI630_16635 [Gordonia sp. (in: high G+C Gram-positive bacteria)]|nr:MAG: hypothetical protein DI630_16635 [Gordonia sp. (in: high G+C Gram-positive bacteria)]